MVYDKTEFDRTNLSEKYGLIKKKVYKIMKKLKSHITINAPVTITFSLICFVMTILGMITGKTMDIMFGTSSIIGIICHVFVHGGGWGHMTGNVMMLLILGPLLEEKYGSRRLAQMMFINTLVTGILLHFFMPMTSVTGASGIVFMMVLLASFTGNTTNGMIPVTAILVGILYLGQEIWDMLFAVDTISHGDRKSVV